MTHSPLEFAVLRTREKIDLARHELEARGVGIPEPSRARRGVARIGRRLGYARFAQVAPDPAKSWDVLRTIEAVTSTVDRREPVLDMGCFASAVLPSLYSLGYVELSGVDLNEGVVAMPHAHEIHYEVGDLTRTALPSSSMAAITAVSVIEHGVEDEALLAEVARLLRPGGVFVFSTDYWPDKIDTGGVSLFGLPWRIFSADDIQALVRRAAEFALAPISDPSSALRGATKPVIRFQGRSYTFLFGALVRE